MKKNIFVFFLIIVVLFSMSSCDSAESGVVITSPVLVAIEEGSPEYLAATDYATAKGYDIVPYATRQAAIIAVENGKADYVIINSNEAKDQLLENVDLQLVENTPYKLEYCAVFSKDDTELKNDFNKAISDLKADGTLDEINRCYVSGESYVCEDITIKDETITVLCCPVFENLIYTDENGELSGKELVYIEELCNKLSLEPKLMVFKEYDEMFNALKEGEGDVIISAVQYTPQLEKDYNLSDTYNEITFGVYEKCSEKQK